MYTLEEFCKELSKVVTKNAVLEKMPLTADSAEDGRYFYAAINDEFKRFIGKGTLINIYDEYRKKSEFNAIFKVDTSKIIVYNKFNDDFYKNPVDTLTEEVSSGATEVKVSALDCFFVGSEATIKDGSNEETFVVDDYEVQDEGVRVVTLAQPLTNGYSAGAQIVHTGAQSGYVEFLCKTLFGAPEPEFFNVESNKAKPYTAVLVRAESIVDDPLREPFDVYVYDEKKGIDVKLETLMPYRLRIRLLIRSNRQSSAMAVHSSLFTRLGRSFAFTIGDQLVKFVRRTEGTLDFGGEEDMGYVDGAIEYDGMIDLGRSMYISHRLVQQINFIWTKYQQGA
jgi:hypothetical protein